MLFLIYNRKEETAHGKVRGHIHWPRTLLERVRGNIRDKTIFSFIERNREYTIKENVVLLETLRQEEEVLFELYCIVKIIQQNTNNAQLQLLDGRNRHNLVAEWNDELYCYRIYLDSTGSDLIKFSISTKEVPSLY